MDRRQLKNTIFTLFTLFRQGDKMNKTFFRVGYLGEATDNGILLYPERIYSEWIECSEETAKWLESRPKIPSNWFEIRRKQAMVKIKCHGGKLEKASATASGFDLMSSAEEVVIGVGERKIIPTGLFLEIPVGYEGQIRPRSGIALALGLTVLNTPGTIDSDYRGEIKIIGINHGNVPILIKKKDRIAQLIISKLPFVEVEYVEKYDDLTSTDRGVNGFGSTGK